MQFDLAKTTVREINQFLHHKLPSSGAEPVEILNPNGLHAIAVGLDCEVDVEIRGHAGYFIAGMNKRASVAVHGNVGWSVGENMMSGRVVVKGHASESAGASAHGGLLFIEGDASSRCAISLKGGEIVVGGSVGHFSAFMAQAGTLLVCGDAAANLGDSLYEAVIYVRGNIDGCGADAREEVMGDSDLQTVRRLLDATGLAHSPEEFKRVASARSLYHWNADAHQEY